MFHCYSLHSTGEFEKEIHLQYCVMRGGLWKFRKVKEHVKEHDLNRRYEDITLKCVVLVGY